MEIIINGKGETKDVSAHKNEPVFKSKIPQTRTMSSWIEQTRLRSEDMKEESPVASNVVDVYLPAVAMISMVGDAHFGSPETDYERLEREFDLIKNTENSYVCLMGDLVDGFFWGGVAQSEQSANMEEQFLFLASLFRELRGKVIVAVSGQHDSKWAAKTGLDPYAQFSEITGAPYVRGMAEVNLQVGEIDYKVTVQHQARGFSMYNKTHPAMRNSNFNVQGADSYNSADSHQKGLAVQSVREFGGTSREVVFGVTGPYKRRDEYAERKGNPVLGESEMGGYTLLFHADEKKIEPELDITDAHRKWS